jgi:hypothetical protein
MARRFGHHAGLPVAGVEVFCERSLHEAQDPMRLAIVLVERDRGFPFVQGVGGAAGARVQSGEFRVNRRRLRLEFRGFAVGRD